MNFILYKKFINYPSCPPKLAQYANLSRNYQISFTSWSRGSFPSSHARGQRFQPRHRQYFKLLLDPGDFHSNPSGLLSFNKSETVLWTIAKLLLYSTYKINIAESPIAVIVDTFGPYQKYAFTVDIYFPCPNIYTVGLTFKSYT